MQSFIFIGITLLSFFLFYYGTGKHKRVMVVSMVWLLVVGMVSYSGYFTNTTARPPRFLLLIPAIIGLSVLLFKTVDKTKPRTNFLLAIHALRLPVEWILFQLFLQKKVPVIMTFKGWNFDIIMGISAILLLLYTLLTRKSISRRFFLVWNIAGLIFLTTIVAIAILSSPLPLQQFAFDQPNIAVLEFPFTYLPAFIVPLVYIVHVVAIKNGLRKGSHQPL